MMTVTRMILEYGSLKSMNLENFGQNRENIVGLLRISLNPCTNYQILTQFHGKNVIISEIARKFMLIKNLGFYDQ